MTLDNEELVKIIRKQLPELKNLSESQRHYHKTGQTLSHEFSLMNFDEFSTLTENVAGAYPILEDCEKKENWNFFRRFRDEIRNMAEGRKWARNVLSGVPVAAVDGSQIYPGNELSLPFGMVNIAWYVNFHDGTYRLSHSPEFITPDRFGFNPEGDIDLLREEGEIDRLVKIIQELGRKGVVFLDGSLVLSFAVHLHVNRRKRYIDAVLKLLEASQGEGILAAYVDNSRASDISGIFQQFLDNEKQKKFNAFQNIRPTDASLISSSLNWGDRTSTFICTREKILEHYKTDKGKDFTEEIAFFYMKTSLNRVSRVEFPAEVVRNSRVGELANIVRAQLIVGEGYPHVLNQAHHEANVTMKDREKFLGILRRIVQKYDLEIGSSLKAEKKRF